MKASNERESEREREREREKQDPNIPFKSIPPVTPVTSLFSTRPHLLKIPPQPHLSTSQAGDHALIHGLWRGIRDPN
jgi:hypothetical protein